jgi:elongation factor Ts
MAGITAAQVKELREKTGLPMMDCKKALGECNGDADAAVQWLRERGAQVLSRRVGRETSFGRFGLYCRFDPPVGAMVELQCESAPVTQNEEFIQLANDLAEQLAVGPGAEDADALLAQPSPSRPGLTLREQMDELFNRIREVFHVGRLVRIDGACGGYTHHAATVAAVLLEVEGGTPELARDICMHVTAMRPAALTVEDLDTEEVGRERAILREAALKEGKPESIVDKMVEGRLRNFYAERVLLEQPYVKGDGKQTVGSFAAEHGMQVKRFVHWELGKN